MSEFPELGFYALAGQPDSSRDLLQEVSDGEAMGLGTVFISERYNRKEAATQCGAAAAVSETITITTGVTNSNTGHPLVAAAFALTMQSLTGGRFVLGIGRGVPLLQAAMGINPITTAEMEDFAGLLRRLFRGETVMGHDGPAGRYPYLRLDSSLDEHLPMGLEDSTLADMADPSSRQLSRIDYLLYSAPGRDCSVGEGTGLFNAEPAAGGLAFPSDHTAVALTLVCDEAGADGVDAATAALPEAPDPPAPTEGQPVDEVTAQAITAAFETYMDGSIEDTELRIDQAEDFPGMRDAARLMFEATADVGAGVRAQVVSISRKSATTALIVYSILLDDQVVSDGREGEAVLIDGRWLVSKATFCDLAALSPVADLITAC